MKIKPEDIDACLPQTQCGLCGYGGCMPYANALVFENAAINLCPPGGVKTLKTLAHLLEQDPTPFIEEMQAKKKPASVVSIREAECIGCTKCIQVCPVDAILGSAKQMHTVIAAECTGCDLCIPACPIDCIDIIAIDEATAESKRDQARERFEARQARLNLEANKKTVEAEVKVVSKKDYLAAAIQRAQLKKN